MKAKDIKKAKRLFTALDNIEDISLNIEEGIISIIVITTGNADNATPYYSKEIPVQDKLASLIREAITEEKQFLMSQISSLITKL